MKSIEIWQKIPHAKYRNDLARSCHNIGRLYRELKDEKNALSYLLNAIKIWEEIPLDNNNNLDLAYCYYDVGLSYKEQDNHQKGMEYFKKGIEIFKLRKAQSELAFSYRYVGLIYKELKNYKTAVEYLTEALDIRRNITGEKEDETL